MKTRQIVGSFLVVGVVLFPRSGYPQAGGAPEKKLPAAAADPAAKKQPAVNTDALALEDFKKRLDIYLQVHKKAAGDVPLPLKKTMDPAQITFAQEALASKIRELRADAKPGDIFTPEISAVFRTLLAPELKGEDGEHARQVLKDDAPASVPLKVNANYPEGATRPTVPASVLQNLPKLPQELEYRIIGKHLILLDTKAGLIADFIPNATK